MTNQEIVLKMEQRQYDALQSSLQLRGSSVEAEMRKRLEQCYLDMVPAKKREEIAAAKADPHSFLRIIAGGKTNCFQLGEVNAPETAAQLTRCLVSAPNTVPDSFEKMFAQRVPVTEQEFMAHTFELLGYDERVAGAFDVDLDNGTFSALDPDRGWRTFTTANICAISHRLEESGITDRSQLADVFWNLPYSEQTVNPERLSLLAGSRPIKAEEISLCEHLAEDDGIITFIVDVTADEREAFGTELFTDEDSYFVFYAVYNTNTDRVSDVLDISLMRPAETVEFVCPLPPETVEGLRQQMDEYCMECSGKHLSELGELRTPPQTSPGLEQTM